MIRSSISKRVRRSCISVERCEDRVLLTAVADLEALDLSADVVAEEVFDEEGQGAELDHGDTVDHAGNQDGHLRVVGDVNNDGVFDSADLVEVFANGEYEDDIDNNSTYEDGDWNGDLEFDSSDLVYAFENQEVEDATYPRLFFSHSDLPQLRTRIHEARFKRDLNYQIELGQSKLQNDYSHENLYETTKAKDAALLAYLSIALEHHPDRQRFADKAKEILLHINDGLWQAYNHNLPVHRVPWDGSVDTHPWFTGGILMDYSMAYDWLEGGGQLSNSERAEIRFRILRIAQIDYSITSTPHDQLGQEYLFRTANYVLRSVSGIGIAALTFAEHRGPIEDPQNRVDPNLLEPFNSDEVLDWLMHQLFVENTIEPSDDPSDRSFIEHYVSSDGVYNEGWTYQNDAFSVLTPYLYAYHQVKGVDYISDDGPWDGRIGKMYTNNLKVMLPNKERPLYGDSFTGFGYAWHELVAAYSDDPAGNYWYSERIIRPRIGRALLTYQEEGAPLIEPSYRTEFLTEAGMAVFRDKWGPDATYLMLTSSGNPVFGHNQADQGSISMFAHGTHVIRDPGYGRGYKWEEGFRRHGGRWDWITSGLGHSGITVDSIYRVHETPSISLKRNIHPRADFSLERAPDPGQIINTLASENIDYAEAIVDYEVKEARLVRGVAFPRHQYFILNDRITANDHHDYGWQLQLTKTETGKFSGDDGNYLWETPNPQGEMVGLGITMLDDNRNVNVYDDGPTAHAPNQEVYDRNYILADQHAKDTGYITLLDPHAHTDERIEVETLIEDKAWKVIHTEDQYDIIISQEDTDLMVVDQISTNATFLVASIDVVDGEETLRSVLSRGGDFVLAEYDESAFFQTDAETVFHHEDPGA